MKSSPSPSQCAFGTAVGRFRPLLIRAAAPAALLLWQSLACAQANLAGCGSLENHYGPFDYRTERHGKLKIVEQYHFTPNVESLIAGNSGSLGGELSYTLATSPNHHRALMAMVRLGEKLKSPQPTGAKYSVECFFERALRFRSDDSTVKLIYATFLIKNGREADAIKQLEVAAAAAGDNAFTQYNVGMIYFDIKRYDRALAQAHRAYGLGFEMPELRNQLQSVGKWTDPVAQAQDATDPAKDNGAQQPTR